MSCYEWERGEFKFSAKEYPKFRRTFVEKWNDLQRATLTRALEIRTRFLDSIKKERGLSEFELRERFWKVCENRRIPEAEITMILRLLWPSYKPDRKPQTPKVKDLDIRPVSKDGLFQLEEATIRFNNKTRIVVWEVGENNHACDRAREERAAVLFFELLGKVKWTRGTGGEIIGNDEYRREQEFAGGGANYVKAVYSQAEQKKEADRRRVERRNLGCYTFAGQYGRRRY